ncbi:MAG: hypothetical protein MK033_11010 [Candidatus Caenarcaniphilales bacterium]|nr:hypothetical protein [Candidatus Caenarcaniphilales bacterium]
MSLDKAASYGRIANNFDQGLKKFSTNTTNLVNDWKTANKNNRQLLIKFINKTHLESGKYSFGSTRAEDRAAIKIFIDLLKGKDISIPKPKEVAYQESYLNFEQGYPQAVFHSMRLLEREFQMYVPSYQAMFIEIKQAQSSEAQDLLIGKSCANIYQFNIQKAKQDLFKQESILEKTGQILPKLNSSLNSFIIDTSQAQIGEKITSPRIGKEIEISETEKNTIKELLNLTKNIRKEHQESFVFNFFDKLLGKKKGIPYLSQSTGHIKSTQDIDKIIQHQQIHLQIPNQANHNFDLYTLPEALQRLNDLDRYIFSITAHIDSNFRGSSVKIISKALTEIKQYLTDFRGCESIKHKSQ